MFGNEEVNLLVIHLSEKRFCNPKVKPIWSSQERFRTEEFASAPNRKAFLEMRGPKWKKEVTEKVGLVSRVAPGISDLLCQLSGLCWVDGARFPLLL